MTPLQQEQFHQADQLLDQQHYHEAAQRFAAWYEEVDEFAINRQLVRALYEDQQYAEAAFYAVEHLNDYVTSKELMQLLINVELHAQAFVDVRVQLNALPKWHDEFIGQVEQAENEFAAHYQTTLNSQLKQFYHLGDGSFAEQQRRFRAASHLPLKQYLIGAKFLVRDPFVNPLIRSSLMQMLQRLHLTGKIMIYWLDEREHLIDLAKLSDVESIPVVSQVEKMIKRDFSQQDPLSYQMFNQEFHLQLAYLYPLVELAIPDAGAWYQALTAYSKSTDQDQDVVLAKRWQNQIARLAQQLGMH